MSGAARLDFEALLTGKVRDPTSSFWKLLDEGVELTLDGSALRLGSAAACSQPPLRWAVPSSVPDGEPELREESNLPKTSS